MSTTITHIRITLRCIQQNETQLRSIHVTTIFRPFTVYIVEHTLQYTFAIHWRFHISQTQLYTRNNQRRKKNHEKKKKKKNNTLTVYMDKIDLNAKRYHDFTLYRTYLSRYARLSRRVLCFSGAGHAIPFDANVFACCLIIIIFYQNWLLIYFDIVIERMMSRANFLNMRHRRLPLMTYWLFDKQYKLFLRFILWIKCIRFRSSMRHLIF